MKLTKEQKLANLLEAQATALRLVEQLKGIADADDAYEFGGCISGQYDASHIAANMQDNILLLQEVRDV